jgi:3'-5' exoribonuclease
MTRRFVKDLGQQEAIDQVFLVSDKQLRSNRQGNLYLQCELLDRTGAINTRLWNASEELAAGFDNGDYVRAKGTTQVYQGGLQLIATKIAKVGENEVAEEDFRRLTLQAIDRLSDRLSELMRSMSNAHLVTLAECYLADDQFMERFRRAPAGVKNHHAYQGGLLEHVVQLMEIINRISDLYPELDRDLLLIGAMLHDAGKIDELSWQRDLRYTDEGQLLGHIVLALSMLDRKLVEAEQRGGEPIPPETALRVKHMIVSHHGQLEFGSPTLPMTVEAVALHHLDNLDAKIHHFAGLLRDDANVDSSWTQYHPNISRKLYKGT